MFAVPEDSAILFQIAMGNTQALGELYDRYGRFVYSLAYAILEDAGVAEEVTQDVFLQVWNRANTYNPDLGKVISWLASITRNRAIDLLRRQNVRPEKLSASWDECCLDQLDGDSAIEPMIDLHERRRYLLQAIYSLPEDQRLALSLAYFEGLTQQEIAEKLNEPLGTIKTRIRLGIQKLRLLLRDPQVLDG